MTHFTLLHGAWHGAWCWDRVAAILRGRGHSVSAVTQRGLGERASELRPGISLSDFVADVTELLAAETISETVLVGHSFGGNAITGAAADPVARGRIKELVYLDAMVPLSGVAPCETVPAKVWAQRRAGAITVETAAGPVPCLAPSTPEALGITDPEDAAFVAGRMVPHPLSTYETAISYEGTPGAGLPCRYIMVTDPIYAPLAAHRQRAQELGWVMQEIATGHDAMITAPEALADLLTGC